MKLYVVAGLQLDDILFAINRSRPHRSFSTSLSARTIPPRQESACHLRPNGDLPIGLASETQELLEEISLSFGPGLR